MSFLSYGGEPGQLGIDLEIVNCLDYTRTPIYDGPQYLYDEVSLTVTAVYNPAATSYNRAGLGRLVPPQKDGILAPVTEDAVRHVLSQPRRQLFFSVGNNIVIGSPKQGFIVDAANGPQPTVHRVTEVAGVKTFLVVFSITTWMNEGNKLTNFPSAYLSHRWKSERDIDQDGYSTVITQGHCIFNAEIVNAIPANPDDYLSDLAHPTDPGFRRDNIQTVLDEDNNTVYYTFVDREMPITQLARGVSRIESFHTSGIQRENAEETLERGAKALKSGVPAGVAGASALSGLGPLGAAIGFVGGAIIGAAPALFETAKKAAPIVSHVVRVSLWGNRRSTRRRLEEVGRDLIAKRLIVAIPVAGLYAFNVQTTHDLSGKFVEITASFRSGPIIGIQEALNNLKNLKDFPFPVISGIESYEGIFQSTSLQPVPNLQNANHLNDAQSRGTHLGALVAQQLLKPYVNQPAFPPYTPALIRRQV